MRFTALKFIILVCCISFYQQLVEGQSAKVSPKLDFDETDQRHNANSSDPAGGGDGMWRDHRGPSTAHDANNSSWSSKAGPTIHGVRVTVDTGDAQKTKESKESVEITDLGKHKKRVGIHTDITFEITADGASDANATSSAQRTDKEDASVPIYRGRGSSSRPGKPHDPSKAHWAPSFSAERGRGYAGGGSSYGGSRHYPHYASNVPVYAGTGNDDSSSIYQGGHSHSRSDGWTSYVPIWTTERSHSETYPYRQNAVPDYRTPNWKPCYCASASVADNRRRRDSARARPQSTRSTSAVLQVVDAKLEPGFAKK